MERDYRNEECDNKEELTKRNGETDTVEGECRNREEKEDSFRLRLEHKRDLCFFSSLAEVYC